MTEFTQHEIDIHAAMRTYEAAVAWLNKLTHEAEFSALERVIATQENWVLTNPVMAMQLLCQYLGDPGAFEESEKTKWLAIAQEIGSDYIAKFRRIGHFMKAVDDA